MENSSSAFESFDALQIEGTIKDYFVQSAKWAKFLGIVGYIGTGLMVLGAVFMIVLGSWMSGIPGLPFSPAVLGVIYLGGAALSFFYSKYLYTFGVKMIAATSNNSREWLEMAASNLKSWFKLMGIITIIILSIYGLVFLLGLIGAMIR
jgi:hypothetical protein